MKSLPWQLVIAETGEVQVPQLLVADNYFSRFLGLQFRRELPIGQGLILVPCPSIHTFFVRFPMDVAFLDRAGCVVDVRSALKPWRIAVPSLEAYAVLELPAGQLLVKPGQHLRLQAQSDGSIQPADAPKSLRFLAEA